MIEFFSENGFHLENEQKQKTIDWLQRVISSENKSMGEIGYVFCGEGFLLDLNQKFLKHDTHTDIISFDYSFEHTLEAEIYIATDRVRENAKKFKSSFGEELRRVLVHGILHLCGYTDKTEANQQKMRTKEDEKLQLFHVEHTL